MTVTHFSTSSGSVIAGPVAVSGNISANRFLAAADSAAAPGHSYQAQTNTGIAQSGGQVILAANGANGMSVAQFSTNMPNGIISQGGYIQAAILSPTALGAGPTHNYTPAGWSGAIAGLKQDMSAAGVVTGLANIASGSGDARVLLINASNVGGRTLTLNHQDVNSTAANRFQCPNLANYVINPGDSVWLWYDNVISCWRVLD